MPPMPPTRSDRRCPCGQFTSDPSTCHHRKPGRHSAPRWLEVLHTAADGAPLSTVAERLGRTRTYVASRLAEAYRHLGVENLPCDQRRSAAVRAAAAATRREPS